MVDFKIAEAVLVNVNREDNEHQEQQAEKRQVEATGVAGHRDPDFLSRARANESG